MKERITPYLRKYWHEAAIRHQYEANEEEPFVPSKEQAVVKGLYHPHPQLARIDVSYRCAAHSRFGTSAAPLDADSAPLGAEAIVGIVNYLHAHPEIDTLLLSGGDPLFTPEVSLAVLRAVGQMDSIKILRIRSQLLLQAPETFEEEVLQALLEAANELAAEKPLHLLLPIQSAAELSTEVKERLKALRQLPFQLQAETYLLKGVNHRVADLVQLFKSLPQLGVQPYRVYSSNTPLRPERFKIPLVEERALVTAAYQQLWGEAFPQFVLELPEAAGPIPLPLALVDWADGSLQDLKGNGHLLP